LVIVTFSSYADPPLATQNTGGQRTPGKYVMCDADRVNYGQGRSRPRVVLLDPPSDGVEGHT
jgi:hypothetical protein